MCHLCCCVDRKEAESSDSVREEIGIHAFLVVIASFVVNLIVEGSYNVWNVIYTKFVENFETTKGYAAWAGSVLQASPSLFGPLASAVINRYGCRTATIMGSFIAFFGWFLGSFSKSVPFLTFTFGLVGGLGLSLTYIPSLFIVAFYFKKRMSLASSIAVAGSGIGVFIYAPMTVFLVEKYTWRGTVMICSALFLFMIPCGMLFIVPEESARTKIGSTPKRQKEREENLDPKKDIRNDLSDSSAEYARGQRKTPLENKIVLESARNVHKFETSHIQMPKEEDEISFKSRKMGDSSPVSEGRRRSSAMVEAPYMLRMPRFLGQELANRLETYTAMEEERTSQEPRAKHFFVDFSLLRNRTFGLFCVQSFLVFLAFDTPLIMMVGLAEKSGISERDASLLLSIYGVFSTFGQICLGWLADLKYFKSLTLYSSTTMVAGVATILVTTAESYNGLIVYCVTYGTFISANFALSTIIIVENLGMASLNDAFGICSMVEGLAILVGPPIGGYLYDLTDDYFVTYVCAGVTVFASCLVFYLDVVFAPCTYVWKLAKFKQVTPSKAGA